MAAQLPWELEEKILSRLPPQSLVRFRIVWNSVFKDKTFQNNHLSRSRPQFILLSRSKSCSIDIIDPDSIAPQLELRDLPSPPIKHRYLRYSHRTFITTCDELLFCDERYKKNGTALCNPWLRQAKKIFKRKSFDVFGLGYDNSGPEKVYKMLGHSTCGEYQGAAMIYECASRTLKFIDTPPEKNWLMSEAAKGTTIVSLNGNLYWLTLNDDTREHIIRSFDLSTESIKPLCLLPCQKNHPYDELLLAVFKRDGVSLLKQGAVTRKVEIWVTNKIDKEEVVWIKLMTLPTTNLPTLDNTSNRISYFIYDKTLFMCCADEIGVPCIYIVRGDDLYKKIPIQYGIDKCCHCVYTPNLISMI